MNVLTKICAWTVFTGTVQAATILTPTGGTITVSGGGLNINLSGSGFVLTGQGLTSGGGLCRILSSDVLPPGMGENCFPGTTHPSLPGGLSGISTEDRSISPLTLNVNGTIYNAASSPGLDPTSDLEFSYSFTIPNFSGTFPTSVTLSVPFSMGGIIETRTPGAPFPGVPFLDFPIQGAGTATIVLGREPFLPNTTPEYRFRGVTYDFTAVPEPATVSAVGISLIVVLYRYSRMRHARG